MYLGLKTGHISYETSYIREYVITLHILNLETKKKNCLPKEGTSILTYLVN